MTIPSKPLSSGAPPAIVEYLCRCAQDEELVAWWALPQPRDPHLALWVISYVRARQTFIVMSFPTVVSHWSHQVCGSNHDPAEMRAQLDAGLWSAPESARAEVQAFLESLAA